MVRHRVKELLVNSTRMEFTRDMGDCGDDECTDFAGCIWKIETSLMSTKSALLREVDVCLAEIEVGVYCAQMPSDSYTAAMSPRPVLD